MSIWHWLILLLIVVLLFGKGKISDIMGDMAKGIKSFKKGMAEDDTPPAKEAPKQIDASAKPAETAQSERTKTS